MPRAPRIEFSGAMYHVMNRGDHYEDVYRDDVDRESFLQILGGTCESSGWRVHSADGQSLSSSDRDATSDSC